MRSAKLALFALAVALVLPSTGVDAAQKQPTVRPFEARGLLSTANTQPSDFCDVGLQSDGFVLDVVDGTFDGFWWNSTCINGDSASGNWYIYYMGGQFASAIAGTWQGKANVTQGRLMETGIQYRGTYVLTAGYGIHEGLTGSGLMAIFYGAQPWVALSGTATIPPEENGRR